jgi:hypothetical protein
MTEKKVKSKAPWADVAGRSRTIRKSVEQLLEEGRQLVSTPEGDPVSAHRVLKSELEAWSELASSVSSELTATLARLDRERAEALEYLVDRLSRELRKVGHQVFGATSPLVVDGVVHVEVSPEKGTVNLDGDIQEDVSIPILARVIAERVSALRKACKPPQDFLQELAAAYQREAKLTDKPEGTQLPVLSLLPHIVLARQGSTFKGNPRAGAFKEYPRDQFRADLQSLLASNLTEYGGFRFRFASGADTTGAIFMYVPSLERTAHVGRIWFERV